MPLKQCTVDGKKGWQYGSQHCFTGPDAKKQAIKQMIAIFGPDKFQKHLHSEAAIRDFGGRENVTFAKAVFKEEFPRGMFDTYLSSIASFLSGKADDGQNDSDNNKGDILDGKDCEASEYVDNAGDLSGNPQRSGDGSGNEFNKKGSASVVSDKDNYGKDGRNDHDGDEPDPVAKGDLDTKTEEKAGNIVNPPYNKEVSPETDPSKNVPNYEPPSRSDSTPPNTDNRQTLDPKLQYKVKSEMSPKNTDKEMSMDGDCEANVYSTDTEDATGANEKWLGACAYVSEEVRQATPDENCAGPPGSKSFPINSGKDVEDASRLVGHSPNPSQTKKRIIEIAHRLGYQANLPESWKKPEHQTAYEQALNLLSKLSAEERKSFSEKMDWQEQVVKGPQEGNP